MTRPWIMALFLASGAPLGAEDVPVPAASAAPAAPAADKAPIEELPPVYGAVLGRLKDRKFRDTDADAVGLKFGATEGNEWPAIRIAALRTTKKGLAILLEEDEREYVAGDVVQGALLLNITEGEALFEFHGEKKAFPVQAEATEVTIRVIRQIEGEWAVFFDEEKRPTYTGETYKGYKVAEITPGAVVVQRGKDRKKLVPKPGALDVTRIPFRGILQVGKDRLAVVEGRKEPLRVGDSVEGAKILQIDDHSVTFEVNGEKKTVTLR